jgi:prepilin-type N-terminal cleavage/methylation domain-containing protein
MNNRGFTLVELLVYMALLSIVSVLFTSILLTSTKVQVQQVASTEVASQMNFALQTIQRLIRESSATIVSNSPTCINTLDSANDGGALLGASQPCLKLRMKDSQGTATDRDPIFIWKDAATGAVKLAEGSGANQRISDITTPKVANTSNVLAFTKFSNPPAHDIVQINLTLNYNSSDPNSQVARTIQAAVGKASAATFDSSLFPDTTDSRDIGNASLKWRGGYFSGDVTVLGKLSVGAADGSSGYLQFMRSGTGAPVDACTPTDIGKFYLDKTNLRLYVCTGVSGWKNAQLN